MTNDPEVQWWLVTLRQLISRMERISADSAWAYRASGVRGSLLRSLDRLEHQPGGLEEPQRVALLSLSNLAYEILNHAAQEIIR